MKTIEIITPERQVTYQADSVKAVEKVCLSEESQLCYVYLRFPFMPYKEEFKLQSCAAEKLYPSIKAFLKSDADEELIIQPHGDSLVSIQTIRK